jgi:hypothetical protein
MLSKPCLLCWAHEHSGRNIQGLSAHCAARAGWIGTSSRVVRGPSGAVGYQRRDDRRCDTEVRWNGDQLSAWTRDGARREGIRPSAVQVQVRPRRDDAVPGAVQAAAPRAANAVMGTVDAMRKDPSKALGPASTIKALALAAATLERTHGLKQCALGLDKDLPIYKEMPVLTASPARSSARRTLAATDNR